MYLSGDQPAGPVDSFNRALTEALPMAVVVCDRDGRVVEANARARELAGLEPATDGPFGELFRFAGASPLDDVLRTGETVDRTDLSLARPDGTLVAVHLTIAPLHRADGDLAGAVCTLQDTTRSTAAADRARLAAIVDSSDDAIVAKTLDGVITSWNRGAERMFGYTSDEAIGHHIALIIPPDRLAEEKAVLARLRKGEKVDHFETVRRRKDGQLIDISLTVSPIRDEQGRIVGASKVARDISERNAAHHALGRSQRRYRRLFDSAGVSLWEQDFTAVRAEIERLRLAGVSDFGSYIADHPEFVDRCINLVRVVDVNRRSLRMFGARSKRDLMAGLAAVFDESTRAVFAEQLVAIAEGQTLVESEVVLRTLQGERLDALLSVRFPPRDQIGNHDSSFESVLVSLTDITLRRQAEQALRDSEALFREMADNAPAILWITDPRGVCTFMSRRWQDFTGLSGNDALEAGWWSVLHPEDLDLVRAAFDAANAGRTAFTLECRLKQATGDYRWVMMPGEPRFDDAGEFLGFIGSVIDITERRVAEDAVRAESQIRETLANVGASLAAELDPEKLIQAVTDAATHLTSAEFGAFYNVVDGEADAYQICSLSGGTAGAFGGLPDPKDIPLLAPTFRGEEIVRLDDVTKDARFTAPGTRRGGLPGRRPLRSYLAVPVVSRSREVLGALIFGHSQPGMFVARHEQLAAGIASWAALALDNARLFKAAQDANATKDEFLATLSHELRTPLNAMLGWTHLLRAGGLNDDMQRRALDALERNGRAQAQLIDDLLDVSRIVSGRLQIRADEVELAAIAGSALDTIRPAASAKGLDVRLQAPDEQLIVTGDEDRLRQIFWNLLSNAVKFTPAGGRIDVEIRDVGGEAQIAVRDTGIGIRRNFLRHVFDRFRQADSSHARKYGGLGLGLAIVRHLTEAHGGTVSVDSPGEGLGATFTVRLPARVIRREPPREQAPEQEREQALAGVRILVVDDERDAREFLATLLALHGAEVDLAASAGEALGLLASRRPQVLLADLGLPDRDGFALIEAVRSLGTDQGGGVPAVAVTAYAGLRERVRAFEAGYGWHIAKPVDPDQLITVVAAAVRPASQTDIPDALQPSER